MTSTPRVPRRGSMPTHKTGSSSRGERTLSAFTSFKGSFGTGAVQVVCRTTNPMANPLPLAQTLLLLLIILLLLLLLLLLLCSASSSVVSFFTFFFFSKIVQVLFPPHS